MDFHIALLPGDGVGPEIVEAAATVLSAVENKFGHDFHMQSYDIGGAAVDTTGVPLPKDTLDACKNADAVLLGAVGGPKWDGLKTHLRPERGLLALRSGMGLFANFRPVALHDELISTSPLRADIAKKGFDIMFVRELTGGIYFGERGYRDGAFGQEAYDTEVYSINEVERIAKIAFEIAMSRNKKVTSVDKANVLETSRLWRATVERVAKGYPEVELENMLVDNCAVQLIKEPSRFDVILTTNMFGDMLSSEASTLTGSIGMLPSSSIGANNVGLYSPIHGSAPDIAGLDEANPIATILSAAMLLSTSLKLVNEALAIEGAVQKVLAKGLRTKDIAGGKKHVSCSRIAEEIA
ncbi:MAG: 3-isopropylmalate dehydrogenase, partial [Clostridiales bacterium]|nr:3-isopropylmalate dehydrogenase [Clostridiales bacterium]